MKKPIVSDEKLFNIIELMNLEEFTVLDINDYIKKNEENLWTKIEEEYQGKSLLNYFGTRLMLYSRKDNSILQYHISYIEDKKKCFRKPTESEKKRFKSDNIVVFRRK